MVSWLLAGLMIVTVQADTTLVLGLAERDLTGDGYPETLRVIARGRTADSLSVTFTIESSGAVVYQTELSPITRVAGLDAGRRASIQADRESLLRYYKVDFFAESKFTTPAEFLSWLERSAPGRITEIPVVLGQDRRRQLLTDSLEALGRPMVEISSSVRGLRREPADSVSGAAIWAAIREVDATVFQFPLGGDGLSAIAWSAVDRRFYRLFECC